MSFCEKLPAGDNPLSFSEKLTAGDYPLSFSEKLSAGDHPLSFIEKSGYFFLKTKKYPFVTALFDFIEAASTDTFFLNGKSICFAVSFFCKNSVFSGKKADTFILFWICIRFLITSVFEKQYFQRTFYEENNIVSVSKDTYPVGKGSGCSALVKGTPGSGFIIL